MIFCSVWLCSRIASFRSTYSDDFLDIILSASLSLFANPNSDVKKLTIVSSDDTSQTYSPVVEDLHDTYWYMRWRGKRENKKSMLEVCLLSTDCIPEVHTEQVQIKVIGFYSTVVRLCLCRWLSIRSGENYLYAVWHFISRRTEQDEAVVSLELRI